MSTESKNARMTAIDVFCFDSMPEVKERIRAAASNMPGIRVAVDCLGKDSRLHEMQDVIDYVTAARRK